MGQCSALVEGNHIGGGSNVSWQRAVSRRPCALDTGRSPRARSVTLHYGVTLQLRMPGHTLKFLY